MLKEIPTHPTYFADELGNIYSTIFKNNIVTKTRDVQKVVSGKTRSHIDENTRIYTTEEINKIKSMIYDLERGLTIKDLRRADRETSRGKSKRLGISLLEYSLMERGYFSHREG